MGEEIRLPVPKVPAEITPVITIREWAVAPIENQEGLELAGMRLGIIAKEQKLLDAVKDAVMKPLKEAGDKFKAILAPAVNEREQASTIIRRKVGNFMDQRQQELEAEENKKRAEEAEAYRKRAADASEMAMQTGDPDATEAALNFTKRAEELEKPADVRQTLRLSTGTIAQRILWKWRITDAAQIPRQYLQPDEKSLNYVARQYDKAPMEIPGVQFYQETSVSVTT